MFRSTLIIDAEPLLDVFVVLIFPVSVSDRCLAVPGAVPGAAGDAAGLLGLHPAGVHRSDPQLLGARLAAGKGVPHEGGDTGWPGGVCQEEQW